jgi:hypothetical protein
LRALVGDREQRDINALVTKILRDLGNPEPPLRLELVRELLRLDRKYYSSIDVSPLAEFAHRIKVAGKQLVENPLLILDVVKKAKLSGLWLPDERRIFIDEELPKAKHRWVEAHEIAHSIVPWHNEFLLGDDEFTLDPECHATIEAEANFGAGKLIFLGERFQSSAKDCAPTFASIRMLKDHYGNTMTSTFWRFVEDRDPDVPTFGLMSQHPHYPEIGAAKDGDPIYRFVVSTAFQKKFGHLKAPDIYALVARNASRNKRGPIINEVDVLPGEDGVPVKFHLDAFCNSYHLLTYGRIC